MKHFMIIAAFGALLAGCTEPEPAETSEPEQEIIPLSIKLPS